MGGTLGFLAMVVALGAMLAKSYMKPAHLTRLPSNCSIPS
ncbi:hypothetical protein ACNKHW_21820 [Shigella flexneri]